jgi:hypothetical protein
MPKYTKCFDGEYNYKEITKVQRTGIIVENIRQESIGGAAHRNINSI